MKHFLCLTLLFSLSISFVNAQTKDSTKKSQALTTIAPGDNNNIFTIVQQMPVFPGGVNEYIASHLKYPEKEKAAGIRGIVYIKFIIEKDGSVSNVKVMRGVSNGPGLDAVGRKSNFKYERLDTWCTKWPHCKSFIFYSYSLYLKLNQHETYPSPYFIFFAESFICKCANQRCTSNAARHQQQGLYYCEPNAHIFGGAGDYVAKHVKYPKKEQKAGIEGTVYIQFIVEEKWLGEQCKGIKRCSKWPRP